MLSPESLVSTSGEQRRHLHITWQLGTQKAAHGLVIHPDLAIPELFLEPSLDGRLPFMEIKVFYTLFDKSESSSVNLWLVPGSNERNPAELREADRSGMGYLKQVLL